MSDSGSDSDSNRNPLIPFRFKAQNLDSGSDSDSSLLIPCLGFSRVYLDVYASNNVDIHLIKKIKNKDVTGFEIPIPVPISVPFGFLDSASDSSQKVSDWNRTSLSLMMLVTQSNNVLNI